MNKEPGLLTVKSVALLHTVFRFEVSFTRIIVVGAVIIVIIFPASERDLVSIPLYTSFLIMIIVLLGVGDN